MGNLCCEKALRLHFANDNEEVLTQVINDLNQDTKDKPFDWEDMVFKELAILINVSLEQQAQKLIFAKKVTDSLENLIMHCKSTEPTQRSILERCFNLLSKILRLPESPTDIAKRKNVVFKTILFMNKQFAGDLQNNALLTLHPLCKVPDFKKICFEDHKFTK